MIRQLAEKHFQRGKRYELQGQWGEAETAYRQACALSSDFPAPYFALARIEAGRGCHEIALKLLETALALDHDLEMLEWRGYVRGRLRRYEEALADYREVAAHGDPQVMVNVGRMLLALGRYDEAEEVLKRSGETSAAPLLDALPRYCEYRGVDRVDDTRAIRYLFARTLVLGTLGDGGTSLVNHRYLLLTPDHITVTVERFLHFADEMRWTFDAVGGGGAHHGPVAALLAYHLNLPLLTEPAIGHRVLVCSAVINGVQEARDRTRLWRAAGPVMHLALGFIASGDPHVDEPDLVGFVGRSAVPWYRVEPFSRLQPIPEEEEDLDDLDDDYDNEWPGFEVGPAIVDPNINRVCDELVEVHAIDDLDDPYLDAVLDYYMLRHRDLRAFEWGSE